MANAGHFLQMSYITHFALAVLSDKVKDMPLEELRAVLNESDEMDEEIALQLEKARKTHPEL